MDTYSKHSNTYIRMVFICMVNLRLSPLGHALDACLSLANIQTRSKTTKRSLSAMNIFLACQSTTNASFCNFCTSLTYLEALPFWELQRANWNGCDGAETFFYPLQDLVAQNGDEILDVTTSE